MGRKTRIDNVGQVIHAHHIDRVVNAAPEHQYTKAELLQLINKSFQQVELFKKGYWINKYSCTMLFALCTMICLSIYHFLQIPNILTGKNLSGNPFIYFFPTLIVLVFSQALFEKQRKVTNRRLDNQCDDIEFYDRLLRRGQYK